MSVNRDRELNFLEALFGLMLQPGETSESLLSYEKKPYAWTLVCCLVLTFSIPIMSQYLKYGDAIYRIEVVLSFFLVEVACFLLFILLESLFLRLLRIEIGINELFASVSYCLAPVLLCLWLVYLFNYLMTGRLSIVQFLLSGNLDMSDRFINIVPIIALIAGLNVLIVFFYCVRFLGQMHSVSAMFLALISGLPFFAAAFISLMIGEMARPGTAAVFLRVLTSPWAKF